MFCYTIFSSVLWMVIVTGILARPNRKMTRCRLKLRYNIKITEVICPLPDMECIIDPTPSSNGIVLSGTKIRYKCINGRWLEQSTATNLTTCKGHKWLPRIPRCDQFITTPKPNPDKSDLTLWTSPVFTPECGKSDDAILYVHHGDIARLRQFPWHAGVYESEGKSSNPICGATIIASRYLLSAAHCFTEITNTAIMRNHTEFYIMVGKLKSRNDTTESYQQRHDITDIITEGYRGTEFRHQKDIAIIRTKNEITFSSNVLPICMPNDHFPLVKENADLRVAGWGYFNSSQIQSEDLRWITLPYISYEQCSNSSEVSALLSPEKFCTTRGEGTEMSLDEGDSGGGLVTKGPNNAYYLIGIVSLSPAGSRIVMCTHVPDFHRWISKTTTNHYIDIHPEEQSTSYENLPENRTPVCGQASQTTKTPVTAGEHRVHPGEFPWHAEVYQKWDSDRELVCGATIISSYTLLSAAHCFYALTREHQGSQVGFEIGVGKITRRRSNADWETTAFYEVESFIFKNYGGARLPHLRDIVIIETKTEISFNFQVSPICMFQDSSFSLASNELLHVVGWNSVKSVLKVIHLPYISFDDCSKITDLSGYRRLHTEKFCIRLYKNMTHNIEGYDGSGLVLKNSVDFAYYLVGIAGIHLEDRSVVLNTDISTYLSWIHKNLNEIHEMKNEIISE